MSVSTTLTRFQFRRGSTSQWLATTPSSIILAAGEPGVEITSTGTRLKIGDGSTIWANLPYYDNISVLDSTFATDAAVSTTLSSYVLSTTLGITLGSYSTTAQITTTLADYATGAATISTLGSYVLTTVGNSTYAPQASPVITGTMSVENFVVTTSARVNDGLIVATVLTVGSTLAVGSSLTIGSTLLVTGEATARTYTANVSTTSSAFDFATEAFKTLTITAATTSFTATNYGVGRSISTRITNGTTTSLALAFPAGWVFVGTKPTTIAGSKVGILTITSFSTTESQCIAAWAVQT